MSDVFGKIDQAEYDEWRSGAGKRETMPLEVMEKFLEDMKSSFSVLAGFIDARVKYMIRLAVEDAKRSPPEPASVLKERTDGAPTEDDDFPAWCKRGRCAGYIDILEEELKKREKQSTEATLKAFCRPHVIAAVNALSGEAPFSHEAWCKLGKIILDGELSKENPVLWSIAKMPSRVILDDPKLVLRLLEVAIHELDKIWSVAPQGANPRDAIDACFQDVAVTLAAKCRRLEAEAGKQNAATKATLEELEKQKAATKAALEELEDIKAALRGIIAQN